MQATKTLPYGYLPSGTIDLAKNKWAAAILNIVALVFLIIFGVLFLWLAMLLRPGLDGSQFFNLGGSTLVNVIGLLAVLLVQIVVHELIHGVAFWLYTRDRPEFAFKGMYAYAAAPGWYLPRNQHIVTALAPLALMSAAGLAAIRFVPAGMISWILFILVFNAAGSVGDILVVSWLFLKPTSTLVQDSGDAVTIFRTDLDAENFESSANHQEEGNDAQADSQREDI